jgi:hypothetical protein
MSEWNYTSCSKPFGSVEEATDFICGKKYDGMILLREDGSYIAVCPTYPEGFYKDAVLVKELICSETADCC